MGDIVLLAVYGVLLGARHALEPDHLAAVSTMAAHGWSRPQVLRVSAAWGFGHATIIALAGLGVTILRGEIPSWLVARAEALVGLVLVVIGAATVYSVRRHHVHLHPHAHGATVHTHFHLHLHTAAHVHPSDPGWMGKASTAYAMGSLHGLAGSGAIAAASVLMAPSGEDAMVYLLAFATGSVLGMVAAGTVALWPLVRASSRAVWARPLLQGLAGTFSIIVGVLLIRGVL